MTTQSSKETPKDTAGPLADSPFLTSKEAAAFLKLAPATLKGMRVQRTGPKYRKHGRMVRYHIDDLNAWSASRQTDPAADPKKSPSDG